MAQKDTLHRGLQYARLGLDLATLKLRSNEAVTERARAHLATRLGKLHGLPQKIGQLLSMGASPSASAFAPLQNQGDAMAIEWVRALLEQRLSPAAYSQIHTIEEGGLAASLGQVHRAQLSNGQTVAIKLKYPGIHEAIETDLGALGWLSAPVGDLRQGFDLRAYREEVRADLNQELDYAQELRNNTDYRSFTVPGLLIPQPMPEFCGPEVLCSQWLSGASLEEAAAWPRGDRFKIAQILVEHFFYGIFERGLIHADPHPGNLSLLQGPIHPGVILYDFGSVARISPHTQRALLRLIHCSGNATQADPLELLVDLGFSRELLQPIHSRLAAVCQVLFEPFNQQTPLHLTDWRVSERITDILGDDRWNFRFSGPATLLLLLRAWTGLVSQLNQLQCSPSWGPYFKRHFSKLPGVLDELPTTKDAISFNGMATDLKIRVEENGRLKVQLTFASSEVEFLPELVDADVLEKITQRGISLTEVIREVRQSGYRPAELFSLNDGEKTLRVWLE